MQSDYLLGLLGNTNLIGLSDRTNIEHPPGIPPFDQPLRSPPNSLQHEQPTERNKNSTAFGAATLTLA